MSQHHFERKIDGQVYAVQIGWDKPLQHFYCVIIRADEIIYSNLFEFEKRNIDYYVEKLNEFGIELPKGLYDEVIADQLNNVVNRVEWWD